MARKSSTDGTTHLQPQNLEAEQSVLGAILIDKEGMYRIADVLQSEDFYKDSHRLIFEAMLELFEKREPIDVVSLTNRLAERKHLDIVGGRSAIMELANVVPTASNIVSYAMTVRKKAILRRLIQAAGSIGELGYREEEDVDVLLDRAEQQLYSVSQNTLHKQFIPIKGVLSETFDRIDQLHRESGKLRGISTGFPDLDNILAGLQKSDLVVLAARPSVGKTSLALDMARHVAVHGKQPVAIFSLEMSKEQLADRLLCSQAGVALWKMRTGRLSDRPEDDDFPRIGHAMGVLAEAPIFIDDSPTANVMEIRTKARRLKTEYDLGLIVVDYLQLIEGRGRSDNRVQEVSEITRGLKAIARELNVPVLALSQLSRAVEMEHPPIPKLAHLRESGSIEQDADVVIFIYRPAVYSRDLDDEKRHLAEIHIAKHRNGPTGRIDLFFDEERVSFRTLEKRLEGLEIPQAEEIV
ncbi:MAG: replicative DNA helicase [Candidatus Kerfeldbacteria bacterium]|nr:replicative DNA helicase [Candidatus Kerfeldbacteria bacterium]